MSNSRKHRRRKQKQEPLHAARREVRKHEREAVWRWMVEQSSKRQTIPMPYLVACCEYVGETRDGGTDAVFRQLQAEVLTLTGHGMPFENDKRGPLS